MNKTDILIYCDWLTDNNIDSDILRTAINHIGNGIIGMNRFGTDINNDNIGDGDYLGFGYGDDYLSDEEHGDGNGNGYGDWEGNGDGYGDGYFTGNGYGDSIVDFDNGLDLNRDD